MLSQHFRSQSNQEQASAPKLLASQHQNSHKAIAPIESDSHSRRISWCTKAYPFTTIPPALLTPSNCTTLHLEQLKNMAYTKINSRSKVSLRVTAHLIGPNTYPRVSLATNQLQEKGNKFSAVGDICFYLHTRADTALTVVLEFIICEGKGANQAIANVELVSHVEVPLSKIKDKLPILLTLFHSNQSFAGSVQATLKPTAASLALLLPQNSIFSAQEKVTSQSTVELHREVISMSSALNVSIISIRVPTKWHQDCAAWGTVGMSRMWTGRSVKVDVEGVSLQICFHSGLTIVSRDCLKLTVKQDRQLQDKHQQMRSYVADRQGTLRSYFPSDMACAVLFQINMALRITIEQEVDPKGEKPSTKRENVPNQSIILRVPLCCAVDTDQWHQQELFQNSLLFGGTGSLDCIVGKETANCGRIEGRYGARAQEQNMELYEESQILNHSQLVQKAVAVIKPKITPSLTITFLKQIASPKTQSLNKIPTPSRNRAAKELLLRSLSSFVGKGLSMTISSKKPIHPPLTFYHCSNYFSGSQALLSSVQNLRCYREIEMLFSRAYEQVPASILAGEIAEQRYAYCFDLMFLFLTPLQSGRAFALPRSFVVELLFWPLGLITSVRLKVDASTGEILPEGTGSAALHWEISPQTIDFPKFIDYLYSGCATLTLIDAHSQLIFGVAHLPLRELIRRRRNCVTVSLECSLRLRTRQSCKLEMEVKCSKRLDRRASPKKEVIDRQTRIERYKQRRKIVQSHQAFPQCSVRLIPGRRQFFTIPIHNNHQGLLQLRPVLQQSSVVGIFPDYSILPLPTIDTLRAAHKCNVLLKLNPQANFQLSVNQKAHILLTCFTLTPLTSQQVLNLSLIDTATETTLYTFCLRITCIQSPCWLSLTLYRREGARAKFTLPITAQNNELLIDDPKATITLAGKSAIFECQAPPLGKVRHINIGHRLEGRLVQSQISIFGCQQVFLKASLMERTLVSFPVANRLFNSSNPLPYRTYFVCESQDVSLYPSKNTNEGVAIDWSKPMTTFEVSLLPLTLGRSHYHCNFLCGNEDLTVVHRIVLTVHVTLTAVRQSLTINMHPSGIIKEAFTYHNPFPKRAKFKVYSTNAELLWADKSSFEAEGSSDTKLSLVFDSNKIVESACAQVWIGFSSETTTEIFAIGFQMIAKSPFS